MEHGFMPLKMHAMIEPFAAILIIAAPWIFGFSGQDEAVGICIGVGVVMLVAGAFTDWRFALMRLIPLPVHMATDMLLGAILILSPFILGFSDNGAATRFMVIVGVIEILTAAATRWDPAEADDSAIRTHRGTTAH